LKVAYLKITKDHLVAGLHPDPLWELPQIPWCVWREAVVGKGEKRGRREENGRTKEGGKGGKKGESEQ